MSHQFSRRTLRALVAGLVAVGLSLGLGAEEGAEEGAETQAPAEETVTEEYMRVMDLVDSLRVYNAQQEGLLRHQEQEIVQLGQSIEQITHFGRQVGPVTERMIDGLATFIELDSPFLIEKRRARVEELRATLDRVDVSTAEKFRRVIEVYQEEIKYGTTYEAYADFIDINGQSRQVDVLRWGRVVLAFQTPDRGVTGVWDNEARQWVVLGDEYADGVRDALRVARKTMTDDIVLLPTRAPAS